MKVIRFEATLKADDSLGVPAHVAEQLPRDRQLRLAVLLPEASEAGTREEAAWQRLTHEEFLKGYAESDSVYDSL